MATTFKVRDKETGKVFTIRDKTAAPDTSFRQGKLIPRALDEVGSVDPFGAVIGGLGQAGISFAGGLGELARSGAFGIPGLKDLPGKAGEFFDLPEGETIPSILSNITEPQGKIQTAAKFTGELSPFLGAAGKAKAGKKVLDLASSNFLRKVMAPGKARAIFRKGAKMGNSAIIEGGIFAAVDTAIKGDTDETGTALMLGALFPTAATALKSTLGGIGTGLKKFGTAELRRTIKAGKRTLEKEGFDAADLVAEGVTGNLHQQLAKVRGLNASFKTQAGAKLAQLPDTRLDLVQIFKEAEKRLIGRADAGKNKALKNTFNQMRKDTFGGRNPGVKIDERGLIVPEENLVTLDVVQNLKRKFGQQASFLKDPNLDMMRINPNIAERGKVSNAVYGVMREQLDAATSSLPGETFRSINKRWSRMIAAEKALIERIEVADRSDFLSLSTIIFGAGALGEFLLQGGDVLDNKFLGALLLHSALRSPRIGARIGKTGKALEEGVKGLPAGIQRFTGR